MHVRLSLGQRLGLGFFLLSGLVVLTAGLGVFSTRSFTQTSETIQANTHLYEQADEVLHTSAEITAIIDRMLLTRQTGGFIEEQLADGLSGFNQQLANLTVLQTADNQNSVNTLRTFGLQLTDLVDDTVGNARDGRWAQAQVLRHTEISSLQRRFEAELAQLTTTYQTNLDDALNRQARLQQTLGLVWVLMAIVAIGGGSFTAFAIWRSTTTPINLLIEQTHHVMQRDFTSVPPLERHDEIGRLSQAFSQMTDWLRESYHQLEERVAERTLALSTSLEVSQSLSTILDPQQLMQEVVNQIRSAFRFYHAQIYLLDEATGDMVLASGTGEAGNTLLRRQHRLPRGRGLVGQAANTRLPVLIPDVTQDANWLPNPLLPDTKAETAVPLLYGDTLLGVLDVQQNVVNGLTQADVRLLQSVASQVAIALRNARLYADTQGQAERASILNQIGQRIQRAPDVESVLQVAAAELGQALPGSRASVQLALTPNAPNGRTQGKA
ncbi:MAG: GAF domain-containing protein [Anaerolineales bacterium]|nr:GAF domain-containing protein [Anaerolineales bacterium]